MCGEERTEGIKRREEGSSWRGYREGGREMWERARTEVGGKVKKKETKGHYTVE